MFFYHIKNDFLHSSLNTLPDGKILDRPKIKTFAGYKINLTERLKFSSVKIENILGKRENAGSTIFSFPQNVFKSPHPQGC